MRYNTLSEVPLEAKDFEAWLKEQEENSVVGFTCDSDGCPLASYLGDCLGSNEQEIAIEVSPEFYGIDGGEEVWELPDWAKDFVAKTDKAGGEDGDEYPVIAAEALLTLHAVVAAQ